MDVDATAPDDNNKVTESGASSAKLMDNLKNKVLKLSLDNGGLGGYLQKTFNTVERKRNFANMLLTNVRMSGGVDYNHQRTLVVQDDMSATYKVHVSMLGFDKLASCKRMVEHTVVDKLITEMFKDGFVTFSEPMVCHQPTEMAVKELALTDADHLMCHFSLAYVKGMARACTLLTLLDLIFEDGSKECIDTFKELINSARVITIRLHQTIDRIDLAIQNAKLAQRGRIRKANNVVTWAGIVMELKHHGVTDPATLVRAWNEKCASKESHIIGQKRTALLSLLHLETSTMNIVFDIVAEHGWEHSPFTEDFLASPKFKKDWYLRGVSKAWQLRTKVTEPAQALLMEHLQVHYRTLPGNAKKKMSKADLEELLLVAALATSLCDEVKEIMPVKDDVLQQDFLDLFITADQAVILELQMAVQTKDQNFKPADIHCLKAIMQAHVANTANNVMHLQADVDMEAGKLEQKAYELDMEKIDNDCKRFEIWRTKMLDRDAQSYYQELDWKRKQVEAGELFAEEWVENHICILGEVESTGAGKNANTLNDFHSKSVESVNLARGAKKVVLGLINWVSPSQSAADLRRHQIELMGLLDQSSASFTTGSVWVGRREEDE